MVDFLLLLDDLETWVWSFMHELFDNILNKSPCLENLFKWNTNSPRDRSLYEIQDCWSLKFRKIILVNHWNDRKLLILTPINAEWTLCIHRVEISQEYWVLNNLSCIISLECYFWSSCNLWRMRILIARKEILEKFRRIVCLEVFAFFLSLSRRAISQIKFAFNVTETIIAVYSSVITSTFDL